ncbi:hypothetical protein [Francisella philomiragia]|nr:hypothetical protein [Francisella philomiragia]MBK2286919.1 hypothetical protein [Francisella philomiragia]MBK2316983.1 hypothetical protein [Francisella philomiragia]
MKLLANFLSKNSILHQGASSGGKGLSTLSTKKAYLEALESYQPLTEYNKMNAQEAINAIWHDKNSILYFEDYGKNAKTPEDVYNVSRSYADIYGAYKYLNSEQMELKDKESDFAKHTFSKFPVVDYVSERDAEKIEKQLKTGETTVNKKGNPSTEVTLESKSIQIQPCYVAPYRITGTITLAGTFTVKDTISTYSVELSANQEKEIQLKAKSDLANALGTLSIEKALPEGVHTISFSSNFGEYTVNLNPPEPQFDGSLKVTGSISNEQSLVDKNIDGQEIKGNLHLDFDLNLKEMIPQEALSYGVLTKKVLSTVAISAVSAAAITAAPILVVAGTSAAVTGASAIGATVIARAVGLATIFTTATVSYA